MQPTNPSNRHDTRGRRYRLLSITLTAFGGLAALLAANAPRPLSAADAAEVSWLSATNGDWTDDTNWSSGESPASASTDANVTIAATSEDLDAPAYTVTFAPAQPPAQLVNIRTLTLGNLAAPHATLTIASGTLTIDRGASDMNSPALALTNSALTIASGATVYVRSGLAGTNAERGLVLNGNADVTVNGALHVQRSSGAENPTAGSGGGLLMIAASGQTNTFTLAGSGAVANFGYTFIGTSGNAGFNHAIIDGGAMSARALALGTSGTSGTTANYNNTLTIKNGGTLSTGSLSIGGGSGNAGNGELILEAGTVTITGGNLDLGTFGSSQSSGWPNTGTGRVTVKSGTFTVAAGNIMLGSSSSYDFANNKASGIIDIEGGTFTLNPADNNARTIALSAISYNSGTINISGNGAMNLASNAGNNTLDLASADTRGEGDGVATLNLSGNGTLNVDILKATTDASVINLAGGLLTVKQAIVSNKTLTVGNGADAATLRLLTATGSGDHTFAEGLAISAKARLEGSGKIATGLATISGALAPTGALEFADGLALLDGATIDLNNASGTLVISGGNLTIADAATIHISLDTFTGGTPVTLFSLSGNVAQADLSKVNFLINGVSVSGAWNGNTLQITTAAIPEPANIIALLVASGLVFAILRRRHRREN
ncbi:MAG: PEP-CTERM sorting domain-containing protein [Opitutaceae bacterium]|jgi:hypothetical protein|nr:PEP-CTERM sorting domain-containing protein [Opitutaceae bacterium]